MKAIYCFRELLKAKLFSEAMFFIIIFTYLNTQLVRALFFIQIYMDAPPEVPGVSKNQIFFYK